MFKLCLFVLLMTGGCVEFAYGVQYRMMSVEVPCIKKVLVPAPPPEESLVKVYLYNKDYYDFHLTTKILDSNFKLPECDDVRMLTHGFEQTRFDWFPIINAFLLNYENVSVIMFDYTRLAKRYQTTLQKLPELGSLYAEFMVKISKTTPKKLSEIHFIGFGFGAQLWGNAGRKMEAELKFGLLLALDPTVSGFNENSKYDRDHMVNKSSAYHVRIIHTGGHNFGVMRPIGHSDYYVNGGMYQPGCDGDIAQCSHIRAMDYLLEAVVNPKCIEIDRCASWYDLIFNFECRIVGNSRMLYNFTEDATEVDPMHYGIFFLATSHFRPFFIGRIRYLYIANNLIHVSHTNGTYGSDYALSLPCARKGLLTSLNSIFFKPKPTNDAANANGNGKPDMGRNNLV